MTRKPLRHAFTRRDVSGGAPVLRCAHTGCRVVWHPDRAQPAGQCRGRRPLEWIDTGYGWIPGCSDCSDFLSQPFMAEAIASVGIETGGVNVPNLLDQYHANRHQEPQ